MFYCVFKGLVFIFLAIDFFVATCVLWSLSFLPATLRKKCCYSSLFYKWCRTFLRFLGVTIQVHQHYEAKLPHHYLVISNHPSLIEDIGMLSLFNAVYLAKKEVKNWWIFGRISHAAGTLFFDRDSKEDRKNAQELIKNALLQGLNVGLYPEGGAKGRRIHFPFQRGGIQIASDCDLPVIPVFIYYPAQEDFEWGEQTFLQKIIEVIKSRNKIAEYHIFDPVYPNAYPNIQACLDDLESRYKRWQEKYLL